MSEWESTKNMGNTWNPTKEENGDPKEEASENDFIDGYYVNKKENVGQHHATVHSIETKDGELHNVWGTTALNTELEKVRIGSFVRIKWLGKLLTKKGAEKPPKQRVSTDSFHAWDVFVSKETPPKQIVENKSKHDTALSQDNGKSFASEKKDGYDDNLPF